MESIEEKQAVTLTLEESDRLPFAAAFTDRKVRVGFFRKIFTIFLVQALFLMLASFASTFAIGRGVMEFWLARWQMGSFFTFPPLLLLLIFCRTLKRKSPQNIMVFAVYSVIVVSNITGLAALLMMKDHILIISGTISAQLFSLILFTFKSKLELTLGKTFIFLSGFTIGLVGVLEFCSYVGFLGNLSTPVIWDYVAALLFTLAYVHHTVHLVKAKEVEDQRETIHPNECILACIHVHLRIIILSPIYVVVITISYMAVALCLQVLIPDSELKKKLIRA